MFGHIIFSEWCESTQHDFLVAALTRDNDKLRARCSSLESELARTRQYLARCLQHAEQVERITVLVEATQQRLCVRLSAAQQHNRELSLWLECLRTGLDKDKHRQHEAKLMEQRMRHEARLASVHAEIAELER